MRSKCHWLLVGSLFLLTGMRDPFRPPDDHCASGQLSHWRYLGMVGGANSVGIVQDEQNRWHRVREDERFPAGWRVLSIKETELIVDVGEGCEPKAWRWQREGSKNEKSKDSRSAADAQQSRVGQSGKESHPGGR